MAEAREICVSRPGGAAAGSWRTSLAEAIRDAGELLEALGLPRQDGPGAKRGAAQFPVLVPRSYLARMRPGDRNDPLLLQVLPLEAEASDAPGFGADPVGDAAAKKAPGLLHKYAGRALLILSGTCAIHCRYCFRRHYPYAEDPRRMEDWAPALEAIARDDTLHEVILSGGDPLVLSDSRLGQVLAALTAIPHVTRVRIHSRLPIVAPDRVTDGLLDVLRGTRLQPVMVVHANHPRELVADCADALRRMVQGGVPTLNQAVLLRRVNDDVDTLAGLSESLVNLGVLPYYLHQLDRVAGAAHFEVSEEQGRTLWEALHARLPGYAVPRYVRETPGAMGKTPIL